MRKLLSRLNLVFCFLMVVMISANDAYAADCYEMQTGIPESGALSGVWGSSSSDVFAVGYEFVGDSIILHFDGFSWTSMSHYGTDELHGIWGTSSTDIYAVGYHRPILHYDGTSWSTISGTNGSYRGIWGSSNTDIFLISGGWIFHFDGSTLSTMYNGTETLFGIWGSSSTDVFAVGSQGTILHYDGYEWSAMESGLEIAQLGGVWGSSGSDVFVVGSPEGGPDDIILHYNGTDWSLMDLPVRSMPWAYFGIWGTSESDVFAVGLGGIVMHYDGNEWSDICQWMGGYNLFNVWGTSGTDVFVVGLDGIILHYSEDEDNDGVGNEIDNCPVDYNPDQQDDDYDGAGYVCDNCPSVYNPEQIDNDYDAVGDACDDSDGDSINDNVDNCPMVQNLNQLDWDSDGFGDVCDQGARFAVLDQSDNKVSIFDPDGDLICEIDFSSIGTPYYLRDSGSSGWLLKGQHSGEPFYNIWHMDASGAIRNIFSDNISPGPYYSSLSNGNFVVNTWATGEISLYDSSGTLIESINAWTEPDGWSYEYVLMGDIAGLVDGGFVVLTELGAPYFGGAGITPYLYFYDNELNLTNKVDISSSSIIIFTLVGRSSGGFVGIGNTEGSDLNTHLFYYDSSGNLEGQLDITGDIPSVLTKNFMNFTISSLPDDGVIVTEINGSNVWIYHSPPVQFDLSDDGVGSIGGIGGSYFQSDNDGIPYDVDNCPDYYNPLQEDGDGDEFGDVCDNCPDTPNLNQDDTYPPGGNNCGDACECEGDFDDDGEVKDGDIADFKAAMGRGALYRPCSICIGGANDGDFCWNDGDCPGGTCEPNPTDPCYGDFDCDGDVKDGDIVIFKADMGRGPLYQPCPECSGFTCGY